MLFGSILPDIATTSSGFISREEIHNSPQEFYEFVKNNEPKLLDLALGVLLHSGASKGADFYTDDFETGFAYKNGKHINKDVAKLLRSELDETSIYLSHNFIEGAMDLLLAKEKPDLVIDYKNVQKNVIPSAISGILAKYLKLNQEDVERELETFKDLMSYKHLTSKEDLVNEIVSPLLKARFDIDIDNEEAVRIFDKATEIIKDSYLYFLDDAVSEMKVTFGSYL